MELTTLNHTSSLQLKNGPETRKRWTHFVRRSAVLLTGAIRTSKI